MKKLSACLLLLSLIIIFISACSSKDDTPAVTPSPPSTLGVELRADAGDGEVTLYWSMVAGANTYNVYYKASGTPTKTSYDQKITGLPSAPYNTGKVLNNGTTYYFAFTAVSTANGEGDLSEIMPATPQSAPIPPEFPKNVRANNADSQTVIVTWTPVDGAEVYNVYQYSNLNDLILAAEIKSTDSNCSSSQCSYTATPLTTGTKYFFYLTAENNTSANSAEVSAKPPSTSSSTTSSGNPNTVPQSVLAAASDAMITLSWTAPTGATPNTIYNVYWNRNIDPFTIDQKIPGRTSPWEFSGLTDGTTYSFYLTAVLTSGPSFSAYATPSTTPPPLAPLLDSPTKAGYKVTLTWNVVTASPAVKYYYVYVGTVQGVTKNNGAQSLVSVLTDPMTTDATLSAGTYYIVVTAVNDNGESTESNEVSVTVP